MDILYHVALGGLGLVVAHRGWLLAGAWGRASAPPPPALAQAPAVLVQLPLFNERAVAQRLLRAAGALRWPRDRLHLQVLDDSTDDTRVLVDSTAAELRAQGVSVEVLRREARVGYKAGALQHGLESWLARHAEPDALVAIFDADFQPEPDFLERTTPPFAEPRVALVQARWTHPGAQALPHTRAMATLLDGHFLIEHAARHRAGRWFNFNGTAGVWRASAIQDAGGWQGDTLTEDLDLSYRAQLRGWRFELQEDVGVPGEIPGSMVALKAQQGRWAQGGTQTARKLLGHVLAAPVPWATRLDAALHLAGNLGYALGLLLVLLLCGRASQPPNPWQAAALGLPTAVAALFYAVAHGRACRLGTPAVGWASVLGALHLATGLAFHQTLAVARGLRVGPSEFVRTPKQGDQGQASYTSPSSLSSLGELGLAWWATHAAVRAATHGDPWIVPWLLFVASAYAYVGGTSAWESWGTRSKGASTTSGAGAGASAVASTPTARSASGRRQPATTSR